LGQSIQLLAGDYFIDPLPSLSSGLGIISPASQLTRIHRKNSSRPGSLISANNATNWILRGFAIDGNKANNAKVGISIHASGSANFCIEGVTIRNDASHGVYLENVNPPGPGASRAFRVIGAEENAAVIHQFNNLDIAECQFSCSGQSGLYVTSIPLQGLVCRDIWGDGQCPPWHCCPLHRRGPGQDFANPPVDMLFAVNRVTRGPNQQYGIDIEPSTTNAKVIGNHCRRAGNGDVFPGEAADIYFGSPSAELDDQAKPRSPSPRRTSRAAAQEPSIGVAQIARIPGIVSRVLRVLQSR
jgi:hypothetical protein